jgi:outer membrane protein insertion porin family
MRVTEPAARGGRALVANRGTLVPPRRKIWVLAALALACVLAQAAIASDAITRIDVTGNRTVGSEAIRAHVKLGKDMAPTPAELSDAIKSLFATGLFSDVKIDRKGSTLLVSVQESPIIGSITFEGNANAEKSKLEPLIQLKAGDRYTPAKAHAAALKIRDLYRSMGRLTTKVEPKASVDPAGKVKLVLAIQEGEVTKVDRIAFAGNRAFSDGQLRDVITTSQSGWFDVLKAAAFYDPERIEYDRDLLRQFYRKNGFPDARVVAAEAARNAQGSGYAITFTVEEGQRYTFGPVTIRSRIAKVDRAALQSHVTIKAGSIYNSEQVEKSIERMTLALSDQGHASAKVRVVPTRAPGGGTVSMAIEVEEGPAVTVERIDIVGNTYTKDFVIRRELRFAEGSPVNAFVLERGRKRVQALGFFKKVTFSKKVGSRPDSLVVTVEVVEDDARNLAFGAGYSTSEGIVGDVSIVDRNLFGNGQTLRAKLAGSASRLQAEIGFAEPHLLGSKFGGGFSLFYRDLDFTNQASYKSQRIGGDLRLSYPITDEWSAAVNYTLSRSTIFDVGADASAAIKEAAGFPGGDSPYWTSSVGYSLSYDTRDSKKRPREGAYYTVAQDLAGLGGDVRYIRSVGEARAYYPVTEQVTAMGRATGGVITGWGGQDVRLLDLFYRGGESVRGFATSGFGPRDTFSANQDALGGRMFFTTTAELLFPLPGVGQELGLRGAVFADAGSLWGVNKTAAALPGLAGDALTPRASVGVGVAWDSPIGALRVDYAFPLLKQPFDKTQALSFGLMPY